MMHRIKQLYGWILFHLMFRGPARLWEGKNGWTPLALYCMEWSGYYAHAPSPAEYLKMVTAERDRLRIEVEKAIAERNSIGAEVRREWSNKFYAAHGELERQVAYLTQSRADSDRCLKAIGRAVGFTLTDNDAIWQEHILTMTINSLPSTAAAEAVLAERRRQVSEEGWTTEHDDQHSDCQLAQAAACYAASAALKDPGAPQRWPWSRDWWKPKDHRRNLVRAGALILAEIERLDREEARREHSMAVATRILAPRPGDGVLCIGCHIGYMSPTCPSHGVKAP